jgi:TRAP-type C4-dicarboxylate transport system substrate-binding protein
VFRSLGLEPVTLDVRDLPQAVANLHVDAQENPLTNIYHFGLHMTHRHITLTQHLLGVALVLFKPAQR